MGGSSKSSNKTTNNVTNYSLQGMESAETVVAGDDNTVMVTDHGAIEGAFGFGESALEFANDVVNSNEKVTTNAMNQNTALASQTVGFASTAIEENYDFSKGVLDKTIASSANTANVIKDLANSLASDGSNDAIESSTKVVYTMGAVLAVVIFGFIFMIGSRK